MPRPPLIVFVKRTVGNDMNVIQGFGVAFKNHLRHRLINKLRQPCMDKEEWILSGGFAHLVGQIAARLIELRPDAENQLLISCEGAKERWSFNDTPLFDVTTQRSVDEVVVGAMDQLLLQAELGDDGE